MVGSNKIHEQNQTLLKPNITMACGCEERITKKKWKNCTATPKHEKEEKTLVTCSQKTHTGYKKVHLGSTLVKTPGHICPKC